MKASFSATLLILLCLLTTLSILVISNKQLAGSALFAPSAFRDSFILGTDARRSPFLSNAPSPRSINKSTNTSATLTAEESGHEKLKGKIDVNVTGNIQTFSNHDLIFEPEPVRVGFYERFRTEWLYRKIFKPFSGTVTCNCSTFKAEKSMIREPTAIHNLDVVIFVQDVSRRPGSPKEWKELQKVKSGNNPKQKWVYGTRECARRIHSAFPPFPFTSSVYDWSITYHSNSTLTIPYGNFQVLKTTDKDAKPKNWAKEKEHLIVWMSSASSKRSNSWRRENFVKNLGKYLNIHIYGRKPNLKSCPSNTEGCRRVISKYKFYLALENNCCSEYITEKFWRTLTWDVVPIVVGAPKKDYLKLAPPDSFIYADDFESAEKLADYIKMLDANNSMFNDFFKWKGNFFAVNNFPDRSEDLATTTVAPKSFLYSCATVCKISEEYVTENFKNFKSTDSLHFDPRTSWWGGSCNKCGSRDWIRQFT